MLSLLLICPLVLLYIREMTNRLTIAESKLESTIPMDADLLTELREWEDNPVFLNSERKFQDKGETDIIFDTTNEEHQEYMTGECVFYLFSYFLSKDLL